MLFYTYTAGMVPMLTSRAFMPIFITALFARFGSQYQGLADFAGIQFITGLPPWLTADQPLIILGIFALMETIANRSADYRQSAELYEPIFKAICTFMLCLCCIHKDFALLLQEISEQGLLAESVRDNTPKYLWSALTAGSVWWSSSVRAKGLSFISDVDPEDDLGTQSIFSRMEDLFGITGTIFVLLLPVLALLVTGLTLTGLWLFKKHLHRRERAQTLPCTACGNETVRCGISCPSCGRQRDRIQEVGFLGIIKPQTISDLHHHQFKLRAVKRCPHCGNRLKENKLGATCRICEKPAFANQTELDTYLQKVGALLPKTLAISTAFSLFPLIGLIPGIIYYRVNLIASLNAYLPRSRKFAARWSVRVINILLLMLQPIPLLGLIALPLMCLSNFLFYRQLIKNQSGSLSPAYS